MIVDAQVHVWKAATPERPWFSGSPHFPEPFGYEDLLREMKKVNKSRCMTKKQKWITGGNNGGRLHTPDA
jgi:predicted TIM-barrel fold metal-dependent hydrolase